MQKDRERWQRFAGALGLLMAAGVAAILSYSHQHDLARAAGQSEFEAKLWPLSIDGLMLACGARMAIDRLRSVRRGVWATVGFWTGFAVSLTANWLSIDAIAAIAANPWVAHAVAASPALCLLLAAEAVMAAPRGQVATTPENQPTTPTGGGKAVPQMATYEPVDAEAEEDTFRRRNGNGRKPVKLNRAVDAAERWPGLGASELARRTGVSRTTARRARTVAST